MRGLPVADARDRAIEILGDCADVFGDRAQAVAAQLFDEVCEADGIDATARMFDDVIDRDVMAGKVRYYAGHLAGDEPDVVSFERMVSQLGGYYARRSAWANTLRNCERGKVRYARVPGGGETCQWCMMLAGRGFVYHSEASALSGSHGYHRNCDCVAIPGRRGRTAIEGYDPDACRLLAERFEEIEGRDDLTPGQREALEAAWSSAIIGEDTAGLRSNPMDVADLLGLGFKDAKNRFVDGGKTAVAYESSVTPYLRAISEPFGKTLTGQTLAAKNGRACVALPDGDELWAALHMPGSHIKIVAAPSGACHPDFIVDGTPIEVKTPRSLGALRKRLRHAEDQFVEYPGASRGVYVSTLRIGDDRAGDIAEISGGFVEDGALDSVRVLQALK